MSVLIKNGNHSVKLSSTMFFYLLMGLYNGTTLGVLPHCETCGCTLPISSNVVWLYLHQNAHPTKGTNMKCLNMFHLILNPNNQIICFTILHFYWAFFEKKSKGNPAALCRMRMLTLEVTGTACVFLVFAGSCCIFAKCFGYQEHYSTSLVLEVNVKPLITTVMVLRTVFHCSFWKLYTVVTLVCPSHSVNVCGNTLKHLG